MTAKQRHHRAKIVIHIRFFLILARINVLIERVVNRSKEKACVPAVEQKLVCPYPSEDIFQAHSPMKL